MVKCIVCGKKFKDGQRRISWYAQADAVTVGRGSVHLKCVAKKRKK